MKKRLLRKILTLLLLVCGSCVVSGCYGPPPRYSYGPAGEPLEKQPVEQNIGK